MRDQHRTPGTSCPGGSNHLWAILCIVGHSQQHPHYWEDGHTKMIAGIPKELVRLPADSVTVSITVG